MVQYPSNCALSFGGATISKQITEDMNLYTSTPLFHPKVPTDYIPYHLIEIFTSKFCGLVMISVTIFLPIPSALIRFKSTFHQSLYHLPNAFYHV
jgi:hypothetical protein